MAVLGALAAKLTTRVGQFGRHAQGADQAVQLTLFAQKEMVRGL